VPASLEALRYTLSQPVWQRLDDTRNAVPRDLPLQLPVRLGTTTLALSRVRALGPGDLVPLERALFDLAGKGEVRIANGLAKVMLQLGNQSVVELTEWEPTTAGQTMNDLLDSSQNSDADTALDELPVTLTFDLGALEVTLAQLKALGSGSVLPLTGALPPQVAIRVGARRLGTGELVELEGQLAIEILHMRAVS
jgi:type III secretion protein Q